MGLIVAALGSHGQFSYQILTKSGGSPSYRQGPELDDSPVPTAGGRAVGFGLNRRRAALSDLRPPRGEWIVADVTEIPDVGTFDVWHDRAVFHFLTDATDRKTYVDLAGPTIPEAAI